VGKLLIVLSGYFAGNSCQPINSLTIGWIVPAQLSIEKLTDFGLDFPGGSEVMV
jgi:hypothetical protein